MTGLDLHFCYIRHLGRGTHAFFHLLRRPTGLPTDGDFTIRSVQVDDDADSVVRNLISVDPYMRGRMIDRKNYLPPFELNRPTRSARW
ncbi:hypothetical protein FXB41_13495 [Bradyrhizobium canariense]|uniref:hypothetical protein n=1 Tax=Bradyrhizobium canariense TaxID=255045 RepID=UPI001CA50DB7|nr:hypothetical protein [Bradyrhizobium canariense]